MVWQKGQSGNPGGRPKGWRKMVEACRLETEANLRTLISLRDDVEVPPQVRAMCAEKLLDRGWGKAPATIDVNHRRLDARPVQERTTAELEALVAELEARETAGSGSGSGEGVEH